MTEERIPVRQSVAWGAVAFGVTLAVIIGVRLDQTALAVVIGVACGVAASIPTSVLIVSLLRRRDVRAERKEVGKNRSVETQSPPVVVVAPPRHKPHPPTPPAPPAPGAHR